MEKSCGSCFKGNANLECGHCKNDVCKKCAQFFAENRFSFQPNLPKELTHTVYCPQCFETVVSAFQSDYEVTMEAAKQVFVFFKEQGKETRLMSRKAAPISVPKCDDREETIMRLAFLAAKENFNAIIDVNVTSEKVKTNGYQTLTWQGTAVPTNVDPAKMDRL